MGKIGFWAVDKYRNFRLKCGKSAVSAKRLREYRKLHPTEEPEAFIREQDGKLVSQMGILSMAGLLVGTAIIFYGQEPEAVSILNRPGYGEKAAVYELEVQRENGERIPVEVSIKERSCTEQEAEAGFEAAYREILDVIAGENDNLEHVETALTLPAEAQNGRILADWTSQNRELLDDWGQILKIPEEISEQGEAGSYLLTLTCGEYSREYEIPVVVYPEEREEKQIFTGELCRNLEEQQKGEGEIIELPAVWNGETINWYKEKENGIRYGLVLIFGVLLLAVPLHCRQDRKEKLKAREQELLLDYPELVSKFTVLLQAGISVRNVWERMASEYVERKMQGEKPRYVYEEMCVTWNQLKNGIYESRAYGEFGRRCGPHVYMKFGALLEQNLKQGTTELTAQLRKEAETAFEERKNLARRLGEEAQTRLMLPMFMMLFVVLAVIMIPAFLSF